MSNDQSIQNAAIFAASHHPDEYYAKGFGNIIDYTLARRAAQDRNIPLTPFTMTDDRPTNVGSAILKMFDDLREEQGIPRKWEDSYKPETYDV